MSSPPTPPSPTAQRKWAATEQAAGLSPTLNLKPCTKGNGPFVFERGLLGSWGAVCSLCPRPTSGDSPRERPSRRDGVPRLRRAASPAVSPLRYKRPLGETVSRGGSGSLYVHVARAKAGARKRSSARADPPYASLVPCMPPWLPVCLLGCETSRIPLLRGAAPPLTNELGSEAAALRAPRAHTHPSHTRYEMASLGGRGRWR